MSDKKDKDEILEHFDEFVYLMQVGFIWLEHRLVEKMDSKTQKDRMNFRNFTDEEKERILLLVKTYDENRKSAKT